MELKFKKLVDNAVIPVRAHKGDAGLDLTCTDIQAVRNDAGQVMLEYHTGLAVEIPEGYVGLLFPRSSVWKKTLAFTNSVGVVDSGYRGELKVMMRTTTDVIPDGYHVGERFCQLVIVPIADVEVVETDEISASDRGESGFGSTGTAPLNNEYSAGEGNSDQSLPDSKDASTNFDAAEAPSGGEANIPEQA